VGLTLLLGGVVLVAKSDEGFSIEIPTCLLRQARRGDAEAEKLLGGLITEQLSGDVELVHGWGALTTGEKVLTIVGAPVVAPIVLVSLVGTAAGMIPLGVWELWRFAKGRISRGRNSKQ